MADADVDVYAEQYVDASNVTAYVLRAAGCLLAFAVLVLDSALVVVDDEPVTIKCAES